MLDNMVTVTCVSGQTTIDTTLLQQSMELVKASCFHADCSFFTLQRIGNADMTLLKSKQRRQATLPLTRKDVVSVHSIHSTISSVRAIAATGVDFISSGALTHSAVALDISLKIKTLHHDTVLRSRM